MIAALTIRHPAVLLCAAHRFCTAQRAMEFLNEFDVERTRWLAVAQMHRRLAHTAISDGPLESVA
jgi:hypothetical protein